MPPKGVSETSSKSEPLGLYWGGFGCPRRPPWASRRASQNLEIFVQVFTSFLHDLSGLLAPNMVPKTHQNPSNINVHVRVFLGTLLASDCHRKFARKWIKPKSAEGIFAWELILFIHFRHVQDLLKIRHDLHPKNLHFASQNRPKIDAKTAPRGYRNLYRISKRFWKVLGCENDAMLDPCWRPRCHKIRQNSMSET